jgi:hypothetical protein
MSTFLCTHVGGRKLYRKFVHAYLHTWSCTVSFAKNGKGISHPRATYLLLIIIAYCWPTPHYPLCMASHNLLNCSNRSSPQLCGQRLAQQMVQLILKTYFLLCFSVKVLLVPKTYPEQISTFFGYSWNCPYIQMTSQCTLSQFLLYLYGKKSLRG